MTWWPFYSRKVDADMVKRRSDVEQELASEQEKMQHTIQTIQSASRVMQNMAGLMTIMNLANHPRLTDDG